MVPRIQVKRQVTGSSKCKSRRGAKTITKAEDSNDSRLVNYRYTPETVEGSLRISEEMICLRELLQHWHLVCQVWLLHLHGRMNIALIWVSRICMAMWALLAVRHCMLTHGTVETHILKHVSGLIYTHLQDKSLYNHSS